MPTTTNAYGTFKLTFPGTEVVSICANPQVQAEMRTLATHGLSPVRVLERFLSPEAKRFLGDRRNNSHSGRVVRDAISNTHVPSGGRDRKMQGPTYKSGALYIRRA